ncbi:hypothetical protein CSUNSWCD_163 [Campylobacter showae CSUNSWCD]|uniref:Uncharacterized protein n=1 Tax=Campylobacter showae CSUNSWCD TaxID=1244083 RepID=M5ISZ7_9BACT|nr:hypothetical protein CSUNSWCD_163 [Campylobacter showae CSUNSWCD]
MQIYRQSAAVSLSCVKPELNLTAKASIFITQILRQKGAGLGRSKKANLT